MVIKRFFHIIIMSIIVLTFFVVPVYADDNSISESLLNGDFPDYFDFDEFCSIRNAVLGDSIVIDETLNLNRNVTAKGIDSISIDTNNAYKVYNMLDKDFIQNIIDGDSINNMISDEYWWYYITDEGAVIDVRLGNEQWEVVGYGVPTEATLFDDTIKLDDLDKAKEKISTQYNANIEDLKCFEYSPVRTYFVLFTTDVGEFLVPFSCRPDFTNLTNGQVYTPLEMAEILKEHFENDDVMINSLGTIGGYGLSSQTNSNYNNYYAWSKLIVPFIKLVKIIF